MKGALIKAHGILDNESKANLIASMITRKLKFARQQVVELQQQQDQLDAAGPLATFLEKVKAGTYDLFASLQEVNAKAGVIDAPHKAVTRLLNEFEADVITPRNDLAHARSSFNGGKETLTRNGRIYDGQRFSDLRTQLMQHHENLLLIADKYVAEIELKLRKPEG